MRPTAPLPLAALLALSACEPSADPDSGPRLEPSGLETPIVYVARTSMNGLLPVEAAGRDERPGGELLRLDPDGRHYPLVVGPPLYDVARPAVSPDGQTVAFAAIEQPDDPWTIWTVPAAGGAATQVTHPTDNPVQDAIDAGGEEFSALAGMGDYSPFWLADGRIGFASTRYPTLAASCGRREPNIYIIQPGDWDPVRITTTRSGIVDPWPLADGRIVGAYYVDNMNIPHPEAEGLRPLVAQRHWQARYWNLWAFDPDGTGAARYANVLGGVGEDQEWGVHQAKELPDGRLVASVRRDATLIDLDPYKSAVVFVEPGWVERRELEGLGLPLETTEGYAMCPAPLPEGRIVLSWGQQRINGDGNEIRPDFGLFVVDDELNPDSMTLVVNEPGVDELDAVPIEPWDAEILEVGVDFVPTEDPREDEGEHAYLTCENVFADLPLGTMERLSPTPGSVWEVWFWDDSQQFDTEDNPRLNKQMPEFLGSVPVAHDGSWQAAVPADRPFFYMLVGPSGVAARMRHSPTEQDVAQQGQDFFVTVHDFMRPGTFGTCRGCHAGHMLDPDLTLSEARTNLARLARIEALGDAAGQDDFERGPDRLVDQRLPEEDERYGWVDSEGLEQLGFRIHWDSNMGLDRLRLYPLVEGGRIDQVRVLMGATALTLSAPFGDGEDYADIGLLGTWTDELEVWITGAPPLGLGEVVVHGDLPAALPPVALEAPTELALDPGMRLSWRDDDDPMLAGFQLLLTPEGASEPELRDIGLVGEHPLLLDDLDPGVEVCVQLRPYDLSGMVHEDATSEAACGLVPELRIDSIEPSQAILGQPTELTIQGAGFRGADDFMLSLCDYELFEVVHASQEQLVVTTRRDRPIEAGVCDLTASYANGLHAALEGAIEFVEPEE
jgi:hypothetical protein